MPYDIKIENFEGPLDLLLHLIKQHEMDIYDIPIAEITGQYLATLDAMKSLNLDVAGEFLVMASTLVYIKSRMLLPPSEEEVEEVEEEDPRAELVRRLLEYQKYKEGAVALDAHEILGRDVFARKFPAPDLAVQEDDEFTSVGIYDLVEALRSLLRHDPPEACHEVTAEQLSVTDRINQILSLLAGKESLAFAELLPSPPGKSEVVVSFLAILELVKMKLVKLLQHTRYGTIWLFPAVPTDALSAFDLEEDALGYA